MSRHFLGRLREYKELPKVEKMLEPKNFGQGKRESLLKLLEAQADIVTTHELFKRFDDRHKQAVKDGKYTLILDEVMTAVEPYEPKKKDDFDFLLDHNFIKIDGDGLVRWIDPNCEYDFLYADIKALSENKCLFRVDNKFYLWTFPYEIFDLFDEVYILTYLFNGSLMKYYFDLYKIKYTTKSIQKIDEKYQLGDYYKPDKTIIQNRVNVYEGKLNENISQKLNALGSTWCKQNYNQDELKQLKNNMYNYARNITKTNCSEIIWTTFGFVRNKIKGRGYTDKFVPCNSRATNDYQDATTLMYCLNWFVNPQIIKFFKRFDIEVNQDDIALSNLLQWVWRSNIRIADSNKNIHIYIPSKRMRNLFLKWLKD